MFVEVIIPLALPKNYTWQVPEQMQLAIVPGIRVEVALRKNKKYAGIVKRVVKEIPVGFTPSPILNILDSSPVVNDTQLKLWEWIAQYYMCTEGEVMQAAIPANLKLSSESVLQWNEERTLDFSDLSDSEFIIAEALEIKGELKISEVQQLLDINNTYPVIKKLVEKGVCFVWEELKEKYKQKTENYILLHPKYAQEKELEELLNNWSRAPKQMELLLAYLHLKNTTGIVTQPDLLKKANASASQLKGLIEKGIFAISTVSHELVMLHNSNFGEIPAAPQHLDTLCVLSEHDQAKAWHLQTCSPEYIGRLGEYVAGSVDWSCNGKH